MSATLLAPALVLVLGAQDPSAAEAARAIRAHEEALSRIRSLHVKLELSGPSLDPRFSTQLYSVSEAWRAGPRERTIERVFVSTSPTGPNVYPNGDVHIWGLSDQTERHIQGWDPQRPVPIDCGKYPLNFARVRCYLSTHDPKQRDISAYRLRLLWDIAPGLSLAQLAETSEMVAVPSDQPAWIRLEVKKARMSQLVGWTIDLDTEHGYLVRRAAKNGGVSEVEQITQFGDGIWVPKRIRNTNGTMSTTVEVIECQVNSSLADADTQVTFPAGARVEELGKGRLHIWGADGPAVTFDTAAEYRTYVESQMPLWRQPMAWRPLTWAIVIGVAVFVVAGAILLPLTGAVGSLCRKLLGRKTRGAV
jgi:hypothetical protein